MIERELYIKVLDCLHDEQCLAKKVQMIQERDFQVIGDVIINMLLEEIAEVDITQIKQIICMYLRYSQEQYLRLTYEELKLLSAKASLAQAEAQLTSARQNLGFCTVISPSDGVVGTFPYRIGSLVSPSVKIGRAHV